MWYRFVLLPWWAHFLVFSLFFVVSFSVPMLPLLAGGTRVSPVILGFAMVFGVFMGLVLALAMRRGARLLRESLVGVAPADYSKVAKALTSGPVPSDPVVRQAAVRLARRSGDRLKRTGPLMIGLCLVNVVIQAASILSSPASAAAPWQLFAVVGFAGSGVYYWLYPKLLRAREQLLAAPESGSAPHAVAFSYPVAADPYWADRSADPRHTPPG